jgi:exopolyphosphatase
LKPSCIPSIERWLQRGRHQLLRRVHVLRQAASAAHVGGGKRAEARARSGLRRLARTGPLRLVTGSPAADPDSLAASLAYAWLLRLEARRGRVLPYVPIPRADLRLRPEALELFRAVGLDPSGLLFADELEPEELAFLTEVRLSMVDSDGAYLPPAVQARIAEVLDHHPASGAAPPGTPASARSVEPVGSACTLVAERFFRERPEAVDAELARLLLGPILLDTAFLDPAAGRATERDRAAAARLEELAGMNPADLHGRLLAARRDLPGLSTEELLRRDYKEGEEGGTRYGISSVSLSREHWRGRDPQLDQGLRRFREGLALDLLVVMTGYLEEGRPGQPDGPAPAAFHRELALCAREPPLAARAEVFLRGLPLRLAGLPPSEAAEGGLAVRWFRQDATEYSRKRLQPLLHGWLVDLEPGKAGGTP